MLCVDSKLPDQQIAVRISTAVMLSVWPKHAMPITYTNTAVSVVSKIGDHEDGQFRCSVIWMSFDLPMGHRSSQLRRREDFRMLWLFRSILIYIDLRARVCVCVCVCVWEKERERERERLAVAFG